MTAARKLPRRTSALPETRRRDSADSRKRLRDAATREFAEKGLTGARVDTIAELAGVNKQLIYYHFGDKETLYLDVLEHAYAEIRERERALHLDDFDPAEAMSRLVGFTMDYVMQHGDFVALVTNENRMHGSFLRRSKKLKQLRAPFVQLIADTLRRGEAAGIFRADVDPVQLYISIAALCFFYAANIHTLTALFARKLQAPSVVAARRRHVIDFVLAYLDSDASRPNATQPRSGAPRKRPAPSRVANAR